MFAYGYYFLASYYLLPQYSPGLHTFNYLFSHKPIFLDIIMLKFFCNIHLFFFVIFTSRPTHYIPEFPTYPHYTLCFLTFYIKLPVPLFFSPQYSHRFISACYMCLLQSYPPACYQSGFRFTVPQKQETLELIHNRILHRLSR